MSMTPEEIDKIYIQDGGTIKKPIMVLPGGKSQERRASRFSFFCIYDNPDGDTTRAWCLCFYRKNVQVY